MSGEDHRKLGGLRTFCIATMLTCIAFTAIAADAPVIPKLSEADVHVQVDGRLDEPVWRSLVGVDAFKVVDPDTLADPGFETLAKYFYTDKGIYVGVWCEVPRDLQVARLTARDAHSARDTILIGIDTSGNGLYGYLMSIGLGGSLSDSTILPEKQITDEWNGPWYGRTSVTDDGWYAEAFLPWSMFALPDSGDKRTIGIYLSRRVGYSNELWGWPPLPRTQPKFLSGFYKVPVEGIDPKKQYAFYPFTSVTRKRVRGETDYKVGADLFVRPFSGMQLTATINPDFGQVEQDELEINLTAFETFFPEKRPFFIEGQEIFNTGRNTLTNTRRIGAPNAPKNLPDGATIDIVELAEATDLKGAFKITGQAGALRYGEMSAFEEDTDYLARDAAGRYRLTAEGSNFHVARLLYETSEGDYRALGVMSTLADHPDENAQVTAVDGRYRSADGVWDWWGQALRTDTGDVGYGVSGDLIYRPRQGVNHTLKVDLFDDRLDFNDLGYLRRNDTRRINYEYMREESNVGNARTRQTDFFTEHELNGDGLLVTSIAGIFRYWRYGNSNELRVEVDYEPQRWDDRNSLGNGDFRIHDRFAGEVNFWSDEAKRWSAFVSLKEKQEWLGQWADIARLGINYIPSERFDMHLDIDYTHSRNWLVHRSERDFTSFRAEQWLPRLEANMFLSAQQQLRVVLQWIGLKATERSFYEVPVGGGELRSRAKPAGAPPDDFTISTVVFQFRYKWELAPLSDLFVVYTRGGAISKPGTADDFASLLSDTLTEPIAELFVVKLRYRFGG